MEYVCKLLTLTAVVLWVWFSRWQELQECFEKKDIPMLQEAITKLSKEDAEYHLKRCVDSGLWVPGGGDDSDSTPAGAGNDFPADEEQEEVYEQVDDVTDID